MNLSRAATPEPKEETKTSPMNSGKKKRRSETDATTESKEIKKAIELISLQHTEATHASILKTILATTELLKQDAATVQVREFRQLILTVLLNDVTTAEKTASDLERLRDKKNYSH